MSIESISSPRLPGSENHSIKVLSLDTSTSRGSCALLVGREVVAELRLLSLETHSARLLKSIEFLMAGVGWRLTDLGLVAAGIGPGSFTGIRIGVSTGLGLAQVLSLPLAGISGLDALAHRDGLPEGRLGIVMDAQRSQLYYAEYLRTSGRIRMQRAPSLWNPEEWRRQVKCRGLFLAGDGIMRYRTELGGSETGWPRYVHTELFLAGDIGKLALARRRCWKRGEFLQAEPLYIRPPDAMRSRERRA
ncbi:MAG: tRNA (adenosine(37)-N6)-threonylcarbamoyltransferase complex dimerization subunit type 1 TsaB [Acidobacteria bacterium]|nr:tRNA (adenosine(37)-N6)-threonylcarbamoyltransferase complex dimerization subunit type 1 TsaB [Acidobacteriota bacterium]